MPRFAVLEHAWNGVHWDLMLQKDDILKTWELASPPVSGSPMNAIAKPDHRLLYLDYEGEISGGRGCVKRWDAGDLQWRTMEADNMIAQIYGQRLRGALTLSQQNDGHWQFMIVEPS